jgi:NAD(P)-dependent dehydrogenase (short-subunit alcohol dehydrogenase family)
VVITGAGSGIGRATAYACAAEAAAVLILDIDEGAARETAQTILAAGGRAIPYCGDVADPATGQSAAEACVAEFGRLSGWVNNAAHVGGAALAECGEEEWQRVQAVTLGGVFHGCRIAIRSMLDSGGGAIVNISSGAGLAAEPGLSAYGAAKAGVIALTQSAAVEYAAAGIRVNCVAPGPIDTPGMGGWVEAFEGGRPAFEAQIPQGRLGRPEEIAWTVVFLLSSRASYVNGSVLVADGGIRARLASPRALPT